MRIGGDPLRPAALAIAAVDIGGDPRRPASPRLRSPLCELAATRCARLRRACDRRCANWRRPAAPSRACDRRCRHWRRPAAPGFAALAIA
ncbi:MAG: hypothetical protein CK429_27240 [Mycobacterium sp.]|nr:MAG: hypothetical protein CK429_27240 [Mycobacterium sp.]